MIPAFTVIAMICAAIGWRGANLGGLWRRMWPKWTALALIMGTLGGFATESAEAGLIAMPFVFLIAALLGLLFYTAGATMRLAAEGRHDA